MGDCKTLRSVMADIKARLSPVYGEREAAAMARLIFWRLKGWDNVQIAIRADSDVSDFVVSQVDEAVTRTLKGEPIQYIYGLAEFYGLDFKVTPDTLIPRPETSQLVDMIVADNGAADLRVLDLGTGSGCIAIALARHLKFAQVTATDISDAALAVARENAVRLKTRVRFVNDDMLYPRLDGLYDIIVSNPPYIALREAEKMDVNVLMHEPATALFVPDNDPLRYYSAIARIAADHLAQGGRLYLEINPLYAAQLAENLSESFADVEVIKDYTGRDRFIKATQLRHNDLWP